MSMLSACQVKNSKAPAEEILVEDPIETYQQIIVELPLGNSPVIDGVIEYEEWNNAVIKTFPENSELFIQSDAEYLYIGIRETTGEMIAVNIFINQGKEVSVLHSSAALGTAVYQQQDDAWIKTRDFEWCCRQTSDSNQAINEMEEQLLTDSWVASNSRRGTPNEVEYQIKHSNKDLKIAVSFLLASDPDQKIPWPPDLDDDCVIPTPGGFPEKMLFDLDRWGLLDFKIQ